MAVTARMINSAMPETRGRTVLHIHWIAERVMCRVYRIGRQTLMIAR